LAAVSIFAIAAGLFLVGPRLGGGAVIVIALAALGTFAYRLF
jgi:hypothetical protein